MTWYRVTASKPARLSPTCMVCEILSSWLYMQDTVPGFELPSCWYMHRLLQLARCRVWTIATNSGWKHGIRMQPARPECIVS